MLFLQRHALHTSRRTHKTLSIGYTLQGHLLAVANLVLHPSKPILVTASDDKTWKMWHLPNGDLIMSGEGHKDWVAGVDFHPRGMCLASGTLGLRCPIGSIIFSNCNCPICEALKGHFQAPTRAMPCHVVLLLFVPHPCPHCTDCRYNHTPTDKVYAVAVASGGFEMCFMHLYKALCRCSSCDYRCLQQTVNNALSAFLPASKQSPPAEPHTLAVMIICWSVMQPSRSA
jgi:hypothetical protein